MGIITAIQVFVLCLITYFMIGFKQGFGEFYIVCYVLAMSSTALSVLLGCAVEDPKLGQEMLPILFVPQMLFAGFFVTPSLIPVWLRWARFLCALTYAVRLAMLAEFDLDCGSPEANGLCGDLLESVDAEADQTYWYWLFGSFVHSLPFDGIVCPATEGDKILL